MKLNYKILHYRKAAKLSQEELAARVGVSRQAVSKWELGDATPEVDKLLALARAFGVTTDELLSEGEPAGAREQTPPPREEPGTSAPPVPGSFDRATGLIGRLVRRYGWLAGVRIALSGLGFVLVGALARWGFGAMFSQMSSDLLGFGGSGVQFPAGVSPEVQRQILEQMGYAPAGSPFGGVEGFFLGFATVILVVGVLIVLAGAALAVYLYQKGNQQP